MLRLFSETVVASVVNVILVYIFFLRRPLNDSKSFSAHLAIGLRRMCNALDSHLADRSAALRPQPSGTHVQYFFSCSAGQANEESNSVRVRFHCDSFGWYAATSGWEQLELFGCCALCRAAHRPSAATRRFDSQNASSQ